MRKIVSDPLAATEQVQRLGVMRDTLRIKTRGAKRARCVGLKAGLLGAIAGRGGIERSGDLLLHGDAIGEARVGRMGDRHECECGNRQGGE